VIGGCPLFPRSSYWYANVSTLPVHPNSRNYVNAIGASETVHPDFLAGRWNGAPIGMPYVVVPADQPRVPVRFQYATESDPGPYPIPSDAPVENANTDHHVIVVQQGDCKLYEMWDARPDGSGGWTAGAGAVWDLRSNALRPKDWTSADAAGMPILPGLVRYDEIAAGHIDHAIRMTVSRSGRNYIWPANHIANLNNPDPNLPPMGLWLRLKADFDISGFPPQARVVLEALKTHGAVVADEGPSWKLSGVPDERYDNQDLLSLHNVPGTAFEVVNTSGLMMSPSSAQAR
jgi:hypothetical protein